MGFMPITSSSHFGSSENIYLISVLSVLHLEAINVSSMP